MKSVSNTLNCVQVPMPYSSESPKRPSIRKKSIKIANNKLPLDFFRGPTKINSSSECCSPVSSPRRQRNKSESFFNDSLCELVEIGVNSQNPTPIKNIGSRNVPKAYPCNTSRNLSRDGAERRQNYHRTAEFGIDANTGKASHHVPSHELRKIASTERPRNMYNKGGLRHPAEAGYSNTRKDECLSNAQNGISFEQMADPFQNRVESSKLKLIESNPFVHPCQRRRSKRPIEKQGNKATLLTKFSENFDEIPLKIKNTPKKEGVLKVASLHDDAVCTFGPNGFYQPSNPEKTIEDDNEKEGDIQQEIVVGEQENRQGAKMCSEFQNSKYMSKLNPKKLSDSKDQAERSTEESEIFTSAMVKELKVLKKGHTSVLEKHQRLEENEFFEGMDGNISSKVTLAQESREKPSFSSKIDRKLTLLPKIGK